MSEEIEKKLAELGAQRRNLDDEYYKALRVNILAAEELLMQLHSIKVGDIIVCKKCGRDAKAMIRKIEADYSSYSAKPYISNPILTASFIKKDGSPRADKNRIWGNWSKVND